MSSDDPDAYLNASDDSAHPADSNWFRDLRNAAITLTGWPLGRRGEIGAADTAQSRRAFLLVGFGLGLMAALVAWVANGLGLYAFGAAVFAVVTVLFLTNATAEGGVAACLANLAGKEAGTDGRLALMASVVAAVILARVAGLTALAPLSTMLAVYISALVLSHSAMALATVAGRQSDDEPLFGEAGTQSIWISGIAAILIAIVFLGFWTALLAAVVSLLVGTFIWACAGVVGAKRDRNLLYLIRVDIELAVILTAVAVS